MFFVCNIKNFSKAAWGCRDCTIASGVVITTGCAICVICVACCLFFMLFCYYLHYAGRYMCTVFGSKTKFPTGTIKYIIWYHIVSYVLCSITLLTCFCLRFRPVPVLPYRPPKTHKDCWSFDVADELISRQQTRDCLDFALMTETLSDTRRNHRVSRRKGANITPRCYASQRCYVVLAQVPMNYLSI